MSINNIEDSGLRQYSKDRGTRIIRQLLFPDFITFLCNYIAQIENQRVTLKLWVALGDAIKNMYLCSMYVRKKHNRSCTTSVVVVSKAYGKNKEIQSFGTSSSEEDIESLCNKVAAWIRSFGGQQELDFDKHRGKEVEDTKRLLNNIDNLLIQIGH